MRQNSYFCLNGENIELAISRNIYVMKKEKIVRQKKWVGILDVLLTTIILLFPFIFGFFLDTFELIDGIWTIVFVLSFFLWFFCNILSDSLYQHFEKKWGMTKDQIESYVSRRAKLGKSLIHYFPFIREVCKLNEDVREEHVRFLSDWFSEDELETHVFQKTESDSKLKEAIETMRRSDITERKQLVEMLFKLSVVEDGIHNDEWKFLMDIMTQLKFNKNYFEYFKNRYSSLRTEFDEYEYKNERSSTYHGDLKPYYELLGLEENCSIEEMRRAYHSLAMQHHPDLPKNAGRIEECEAMMTKINEAYEMLRG